MSLTTQLIFYSLGAFAIGTIMGGVLVTFVLGGASLRTMGSGNVGATNALRSRGIRFALLVLLIDVLKGLAAVTLLPLAFSMTAAETRPHIVQNLAYICGAAVTFGHIFNPWLGFKGGKGAATLLGVFIGLLPAALPLMLGGFFSSVLLTGFVGLSTLIAALMAVFYAACISAQGLLSEMGAFVSCMALLVVYSHRDNLLRLFRGEENRFEKAMLFRRWRNR